MRRRALLASTAALTTSATGCLDRVRRQVSGPVRFGHARGRVHDADDGFVAGGLGDADPLPDTSPYAAWLFTSPPPDDRRVVTDALGAETQREWDNEIHNENYAEGFVVLAQVRTPRDRATSLRPTLLGCEAAWAGWRTVRVPLGLERADLASDELADADEVVATLLVYLESADAPRRASVPFTSRGAESCAAANATLTARRLSSEDR